MTRTEIEAFLDSGAFVNTDEGPHFVQFGKQYVLHTLRSSGTVTAREFYGGASRARRPQVLFYPVDSGTALPAGVAHLTRIEDA
jgi:hypothetical protein